MYMSRTFNRDPKYMSGEYTKMFEIESLSSNSNFVKNQYKPGTCQSSGMSCFSLIDGALPCQANNTKMLVYNAEGELMSVPVQHGGPVSSVTVDN